MQKVGIIAEIPDNTTGQKTQAQNNKEVKTFSLKAMASSINAYDEQENYVWNCVQSFSQKLENDTLSLLTDIFEQTFYVPLILGDALATHYGVKDFYGYCANTPRNQYVKTVKDGDLKTTYVYTPQGEIFSKETFISMSLNYKSEQDYEIRVKQFSNDLKNLMFAHFDSDGNFISISYQEYNQNTCYITYSLDSIDGYTITDLTLVTDLKNKIYDEFTIENQDDYKSIKSKAKKTVDEKNGNNHKINFSAMVAELKPE